MSFEFLKLVLFNCVTGDHKENWALQMYDTEYFLLPLVDCKFGLWFGYANALNVMELPQTSLFWLQAAVITHCYFKNF